MSIGMELVLSWAGGMLSQFLIQTMVFRMADGRLKVTGRFWPEDALKGPFPSATAHVRLTVVNVGRRPVSIIHAGGTLRTNPPGKGRDFWNEKFEARDLQPDASFEFDAVPFPVVHAKLKWLCVEDVRGRRFGLSWKNMRRIRKERNEWGRKHGQDQPAR